jgi:hypothetical protein
MIDFIAADGSTDDMITWKQFVDYFYTKPRFADDTEPGAVTVGLDDDPRLAQIRLPDKYMSILKAKFDSCPKMT